MIQSSSGGGQHVQSAWDEDLPRYHQYDRPDQYKPVPYPIGGFQRWCRPDEEPGYHDGPVKVRQDPASKGILRTGGKISSFRRLLWEEGDDQWYGRWAWVGVEEKSEELMNEQRDDAIRAWQTYDIPIEIFLAIAESFVAGPVPGKVALEAVVSQPGYHWNDVDQWKASDLRALGNLALVCRAWHKLCAPILHSRLTVRDSNINAILAALRASNASKRTQVQWVVIEGSQPLATSARLARLLHGVVWLRWQGPMASMSLSPLPPCPPSRARVLLQSVSSFVNVTRLDLSRCNFLSCHDLLRLLASFPSLSSVYLFQVSILHISPADPVHLGGTQLLRPPASQLREIRKGPTRGMTISVLSTTFAWARPSSPDFRVPFPGMHPAEARLVGLIIGLPDLAYYSLLLDAADDGPTWVVWLSSAKLHVEFHVAYDTSSRPDVDERIPLVRWVVVRATGAVFALLRETGIFQQLDTYMSLFSALQTVTFETSWFEDRDMILNLFPDVGRHKIRSRFYEDGHRLSLTAKRSHKETREFLRPISPFWCLKRCTSEWKSWLDRSYTSTLNRADWEGWDPSAASEEQTGLT